MTKDEFMAFYAANSSGPGYLVTPESLRAWGMDAVPCDCGDDACRGWQMLKSPPIGATPLYDARGNRIGFTVPST